MLLRYIFPFIFFTVHIIYAQKPKEERYEKKDNIELMDYDKEFTYGINWNTNGGLIGGFSFKYGWQLKKIQTQYNLLCFEMVEVHHKRELDVSGNSRSSSSYVLGKEWLMYAFRFSYGREILLFNKSEEEGVQVSWIFAGGPTLAYRKPVYVNYIYTRQDQNQEIRDVKPIRYKADSSTDRIDSPASFFLGVDQMTAHLGVHARTSLNFEFGHFRNSIAGLEVGGMFEAYTTRMVMIPQVENQWFFPTMFFILYFGIR
ncbi:MAG: hypothetical protein SFY32_05410 [Bacteroidota bacterium]|nr:hypothetical protein [Bacteroidota bacterium]